MILATARFHPFPCSRQHHEPQGADGPHNPNRVSRFLCSTHQAVGLEALVDAPTVTSPSITLQQAVLRVSPTCGFS